MSFELKLAMRYSLCLNLMNDYLTRHSISTNKHRGLYNCSLHIFQLFCAGLGDAWGSAPLCNNPRETCIKELGSHLLQVREQIITFFNFQTVTNSLSLPFIFLEYIEFQHTRNCSRRIRGRLKINHKL